MNIEIMTQIGPEWLESIESEVTRRVSEMLAAKISDEIMDRAMRSLDARLEAMAMDAMNNILAGAVQRTDEWGKPTEEPTTLETVVRQQCFDYLSQRIDEYHHTILPRGKKAAFDETTRASYLIKKFATDGLDKIAVVHMRELNKRAKEEISKLVADRFLVEFKRMLPES